MKLLLDTNVCIDLLRQADGPVSRAFVQAIGAGHETSISSITLFELELGVERRGNRGNDLAALAEFLSGPISVLPFDTMASACAARLASDMLSQGRQLSAYDALIAGHAIALGAQLVSADVKLAAALESAAVINWRP